MESSHEGKNQKKMLLAAGVLAIAIISAAMVYSPGSRSKISKAATLTDDDAVLGDANAPVTMVIFADYQCPYCEQMYRESELRIRTDYVDTGKVKLVYRDFPLDSLHPFARIAAEATECANAQGKFWQYHDALFERQKDIPTLDFTKLAGELGLNADDFKSCIENKTFANEVELDRAKGESLGIEGTPAVYVGNEFIPGAYPYTAFKAAIEKSLTSW